MLAQNHILKIFGNNLIDNTRKLLETADLDSLIVHSRAFENNLICSTVKSTASVKNEIRIGIKPNLVCPVPPEFGATTHPEIVAGIIEYLREHGFTNIVITEGSWVGDKTSDAFEYCGYKSLCEKYDVPFIDAQKQGFHHLDCKGMDLVVTDVVDEIDFMINVPVLKGHCQTKMTCALKNMKGLLPNTEKRHFHQMGLHQPIAHLSQGIHQDFIVVDHICGDPNCEDGGNPLVRNCIMAAVDPVLVDTYGCYLLGLTPADVPYVQMSAELGSGSSDLDQAEIICIGEQVDEQPHPRDFMDVSVAVDEVDSCSACFASLVPALQRLKSEGLLDNFQEKIGIGQGHQGQHGRIGVGKCTKDYEFNIMGCPPEEDQIYEALKKYILSGSI